MILCILLKNRMFYGKSLSIDSTNVFSGCFCQVAANHYDRFSAHLLSSGGHRRHNNEHHETTFWVLLRIKHVSQLPILVVEVKIN